MRIKLLSVFANYGRILSDYILEKFKNGYLNKYVSISGENYLQEIKSGNKKVVFISRFNNFELMAMFIDTSELILLQFIDP